MVTNWYGLLGGNQGGAKRDTTRATEKAKLSGMTQRCGDTAAGFQSKHSRAGFQNPANAASEPPLAFKTVVQ